MLANLYRKRVKEYLTVQYESPHSAPNRERELIMPERAAKYFNKKYSPIKVNLNDLKCVYSKLFL